MYVSLMLMFYTNYRKLVLNNCREELMFCIIEVCYPSFTNKHFVSFYFPGIFSSFLPLEGKFVLY